MVSRQTEAAIRLAIAKMSNKAKAAHFGSSLSCVEILHAIVTVSNIRPDNLSAEGRDRIIMSKGHAAMGFYATMAAHGLIDAGLLERYLQDGSVLWGHVTRAPEVPLIDASSGSLGHGLSLATGYALAYRLKKIDSRIYCVLSDGELDEGSTWEAALFAGGRGIDRLTAVIDYNKIQSLDRVADVMDLEPLLDKWRAFRWEAVEVDGHDTQALVASLTAAGQSKSGRPQLIVAHTVKGKGLPRIEDTVSSHYHPATDEDVQFLSRQL